MLDFASSGEFFAFMAEIARDFRSSVAPDALAYDFVRIITPRFRLSDRNQSAIVSWKHALFQDAVVREPMVETALIDAAGIVKETLYEFEPTGDRRTWRRGLTAMSKVNAALEAELQAVWRGGSAAVARVREAA